MHRYPRDDQSPGEQQAQRTCRSSAAQHLQDGRGAGGTARSERGRASSNAGPHAGRRHGIGDRGAMDTDAACRPRMDSLMLNLAGHRS